MYHKLSTLKSEALQHKRHVILTGDFNAQVGSQADGDSKATVGKHGMSCSNSRGDWLKSWAGGEHFIISNTHFRKQPKFITTSVGPNKHEHQIDYILVTGKLWKM
eukprot:12359550-Karenia_brevis.AAC.1